MIAIDPKLYSRTVRHTHIDSRDVGILRGVIADTDGEFPKVHILVEIISTKSEGALVLWDVTECELE